MKIIDLEQIKRIELDILKETARICEENNLEFFLGGGTLLGAVRHNGFIPWDDDVDIMMPRSDYEKLVEIFNQNCNKHYKLLDYRTENDYYYPFNKIVDLRTKLYEDNFKEIKNMGINIDVFPIDYLPENEKEIEKVFKKFKFYNRMVVYYRTLNKRKSTKNKFLVLPKVVLGFIMSIFNFYRICLKKLDNLCKKYNDTRKVACISGRYLEKEVMDISYIEEKVMMKFEDTEMPIPVGYDDYLTKHYGDYMKLPPKEERVANHNRQVYWRERS